MNILKWVVRISVILGVFILVLLGIAAAMVLSADEEASAILEESYVQVEGRVIVLEPDEAVMNLVFYQGGLVQTEAYLIMLNALREAGIRVFIPKMPLQLAILNQNAIEHIYNTYPSDLPWVAMGHSLGGATLSFVADERLDALIFLAAYPASSVDLSEADFNVLSITASNDEVLDWERFENTKPLLPNSTIFYNIEGGNHANFGHYGAQRGDGESSITKEEQIEETVSVILGFLGID